jgi:hypothetical protein
LRPLVTSPVTGATLIHPAASNNWTSVAQKAVLEDGGTKA